MMKVYFEKTLTGKDTKIIIFISFVSYFISKIDYLIFHSAIEIFTIAISLAIMLIAIGTIKICENKYFTFLGIIYGFISIINLFHVMTYKSVNIITNSYNIPMQLSTAEKYYESIGLIISFFYLKKEIKIKRNIIINVSIVLLILMSIFIIKIFPTCYIDGYGLAKFKIYSDYVISLLFLGSVYLLNSNEEFKKSSEYRIFLLSIIFKVLEEICFISNIQVFDFSNFTAHLLKFVSSYFLYKALFSSVITKPFSLLFKNLNFKALELEMKNEELALEKGKVEKEYSKYKNLFDFLPEGILILEDFTIAYSNNVIASKLGFNDGHCIINKSIFELVDSEYKERLIKRLYIKNRKNIINPAEGKICHEGKYLDVEISTLFIKNDEGKESSVSVIRDIDDRKRSTEMEYLLIEKEKEEKFKNEFFANISHELRTPINVIYSAIQLEHMYLEEKDIGSIVNYNKIIRQNCLRLIRITNNIIDSTKIQTGFFKAKSKNQNIVNIVEDITLSITTYSDYKHINVIFDTEAEEIYVKCDENLIERIILNLLSNSVKYGKQEGNIEVSIYRKNNYSVEISVKDDGIGIPKEAQHAVFEKFERVDKSISRNAEGSGIGLYLVKVLVDMQGGDIAIKSEINKGTEVLINFPIAKVAEEVCVTSLNRRFQSRSNVVEKIDIEFSDIYR